MFKIRHTLAACLCIGLSASLGAATATTSLTSPVTAGPFTISAPASLTFDSQAITTNGTTASVAAGTMKSYTVDIDDARGESKTMSFSATITPLEETGGVVRPIAVSTTTSTSGITAAYSATISTTTTATIATAAAAYNRHGNFTVRITPQALSGTNARAGTYTGSIVITVN